jgi:hypothetical protein
MYGMNSPKTITIWVAAQLEAAGKYTGWEVSPKTVLVDYFSAKEIYLTDDLIDPIIDSTSELASLT